MTNLNLFIKRRENRLTQKDLAGKIGMHKQSYSEKERGIKDFTLTECRILTKVFDCTLNDLFGEVNK